MSDHEFDISADAIRALSSVGNVSPSVVVDMLVGFVFAGYPSTLEKFCAVTVCSCRLSIIC